jgi:hypothetical protein
LTLLLAAICLTAGSRLDPGAPAFQPDALSLELNYWGTPMLTWRIGSDGKGEYRSVDRPDGRVLENYDVTIRRFDAGADGFRQVRAIMDRVARLAPSELHCDSIATDMPYGQVNWHRGSATASLSFNFGCHNRVAQQVMEELGQATTLLSSWSARQPVFDIQHVRGAHP